MRNSMNDVRTHGALRLQAPHAASVIGLMSRSIAFGDLDVCGSIRAGLSAKNLNSSSAHDTFDNLRLNSP